MSKGNFGEVGAHPKIRTTGWRTAPEGRPPSWCWVAARFSERLLEQEMAKAMPVVSSDALSGYGHATYALRSRDVGNLTKLSRPADGTLD